MALLARLEVELPTPLCLAAVCAVSHSEIFSPLPHGPRNAPGHRGPCRHTTLPIRTPGKANCGIAAGQKGTSGERAGHANLTRPGPRRRSGACGSSRLQPALGTPARGQLGEGPHVRLPGVDQPGLPHLSHDDLRHLFATQCIESGVDIPTVSRWLGHKDGGALAMKTYGRLRQTHSQQQAATADFLPKPKLQPTAASSSSS